MAYWWVSQNQTFEHEIKGGYLWSPKRNKNGAYNQFYENMKLVEPGDVVLSYANQVLPAVGRVTDRSITALKPLEFGNKGENWSQEGWLVPIDWTLLRSQIRPKALIGQLRPHLPAKYSPLTADGDGLQSVYLAALPISMADVLLGASAEAAAAARAPYTVENPLVDRVEERIAAAISNDTNMDSTVRDAVIQARKGQGRFRKNLEGIEFGCRITGVTDRRLLRASHIKPWRLCENNHERLDGHNGLLLTPTFDLLFDQGYMTFGSDGHMMLSERLPKSQIQLAGLPASVSQKPFNDDQFAYLEFHRKEIFR